MNEWDVVSQEPVKPSGNPQPWDVISEEPAAIPAAAQQAGDWDVVEHAPDTQGQTSDPWAVVEEEAPSFMDQIGGGIDSTQAAFQKTGALIADKVGDPALAEGLRIAAAENDAEAAKVQHQAKYGDTGWRQTLNLSDPDWWKATIAEAIPGSAPFLAGAVTGAVAAPPHPVAKLVGAALGGGAAVVLQEVGPAYTDYIKVHPDDEEGATDYAIKKAGLTGVINAASIGLGPIGYGAGAIKHALIQMAIQPAVGVGDTISGNAMEQANIDPETDLSRGVAKSAVGEIAVDAPGTVGIVRHAMKSNAPEDTQDGEVRTEVRTPNAGEDASQSPEAGWDVVSEEPIAPDISTAGIRSEDGMNMAEADQVAPKAPEPVDTIQAQIEAFTEGRKPSVLITEGEQMPDIPESAKTFEIEGSGTLIYKDQQTLAKALNPETLGDALGFGTGAKPENPTGAVVSKDAQGRIIAEQVTDETDAELHKSILAAGHQLAGQGGTVEIQPIEQVLEQRQAAVAADMGGTASIDMPVEGKPSEQAPDSLSPRLDNDTKQILAVMKNEGMKFYQGEAELFHAGEDSTIEAVRSRVNQKIQEREAQRQSFESTTERTGFEYQATDTAQSTAHTPGKRTIRTVDLPESLHNAHTHTTLANLKGKKDSEERRQYQAAKTEGDNQAAIATVDRVIKADKIEAIRKTLDPDKPIYIIPVINTEGKAVNRIPVAYARRLAQKLGGKVTVSIVKTQGNPNTNETADTRLTKQIGYDGTIPDPNGQYIIADDNFTSGRTVMALFEHIKAQGGDVRTVGTLASSRDGYGIKPREGVIDKLIAHTGLNKSEIGAILGHDVEQLTNAEILNLRLTTKRGPEGIRSRYTAQGNSGSTGRDGQDRPAEGNQSARTGLELLPQKSGTLLVKGDREAIRSELQSAGVKAKGIKHKEGLLFGKTQVETVREALEPTQANKQQKPSPSSNGEGDFDDFVGEQHKAVKSLSWKNIKGFVKDKRRVLMGVLTNLQLVEVYSPAFKGMEGGNPLTQYAKWLQALEAERNGALHEAELVDQNWDKLKSKESESLAKVMHDATMYGIHPDQAFESAMPELQDKLTQARNEEEAAEAGREISNERQREHMHPNLQKRYKALSKEGKATYRNVRDLYTQQWNKTQEEMINRIGRNIPDEKVRKQSIAEIRLAFRKAIQIGPYFPLSRFGDFVTIARKGDDYVRDHYETSAQQKQAAEKYKKAGFQVTSVKGEEFSPGDIGNAPVFAQEVFELLDKYGLKQSDLADDVNQLMLRMMPDMSALKHNIHRKRIKGYSGDARRAFAHTIFHGAHHLSRVMYADRMQNEIDRIREEIKLLQSGKSSVIEDGNLAVDTLNEMKARHEKIMNPNSHPLTSYLGSLGFIWYLGASPAAGIVNMTQTPLVTLPMLAGKYGWAKSSAALMRAMKDYARAPLKASTYEAWASLDRSKRIAKSERALMDELIKDGTLDITQAHALAQLSETDTRHSTKGEMSRGRAKAMRYVGAFFHNAEVLNRQVSALAAYRLAKGSGMDHQQAVDQARKTVFDSHFNYASSNRARYMKGDVVRTLTMFKQYSQHMTYALVRNFNQSFKGESPEVRKQARKTLTGILGMHALAAGTIGLPLVSVIFSALDLAFDDDDEAYDSKTEFRNWLADTFGAKTGEAIAKGPVNAYTGVELHTRVSLDELWLRTPDRDLRGKQEALYYLEQATGPIGSLFLNVWSGAGSIAEGHVQRGFEKMTPKFVRDWARAARYHEEGLRTYRGDPIIENTTPGEEVAQALGFAPARAGERYEARSAVKKKQHRISDRRKWLLDRYAESIRDNDSIKQGDVIEKITKYNAKNPARKIDAKTLKRSLKTRARISGQTDHGIYLPKNSKHLMEVGRFAE